ncbi:hypothetical protein KUTeg_005805 [Tegillarca granosa]|uniref:Uncharacterized protein n=1 Tax=Tegillarca granosa TaxID=220873 RepID=A0ABQ9FH73_TEGGR|nr:hypothetical protein KUTeg_005805 [Tegillarca granosa]
MLRTILVCFVISSLCFSYTYGSCALSAKTIHLNNSNIQESATDVPEECKVVEVPPCGIMIVLKADESQPCPVQTVNGK